MCYGDRNYLLCSLKKGSTWQVPLDLNFQEGTKIAFTCNGQGHVHLTGYLIVDEDADGFDKYINESEDEDVEKEEEEKITRKFMKRKAIESPKEEKELKRLKQQVIAESSDDDDNEDCEEDGIDEDDTEDSEDEDDEEDGEDSDEDEEDEDDEDEKNEEDYEKQKQKKQMKPQLQQHPQPQHEKRKKEVQEQPQQSKKLNKQKLTNGKEVKQDQQNKQQKKNKAEQIPQQHNVQKKRVVEGGVLIEERKFGNGAMAQPGKFVAVYSVGRLKNGKKIDSTLEGEGFKFRLGKGEVIRGWDVGIAGMKVGGKRRITIPSNMAYV